MSKMLVNPANAKMWSRFGSRATYGQAILGLAEQCDNLVVMSADLGNSSGLDRFKSAYPEKFVNVGIAEQNLVGVAAGIAKEGFVVFASSFAPFISMRASEQIRMNLGYMGANVKAVAIGSGLSMGFLGNSHFGIEDAAVMRAIPGITVISPADCSEIVKTVFAAAHFEGPMYIRLTGGPGNPPVYLDDYNFEIGRAVRLRSGSDVTFVACGTMVYESIKAAEILAEKGLSVGVVNMHTIKPLDEEVLSELFNSTNLLVTVEEHSVIGGLGSAVAEFKAGVRAAPPQLIIGLPDYFGKTGEYDFMKERYGLVGSAIAERVLRYDSN
jgi:transketolase